jgi:hypothetical protein
MYFNEVHLLGQGQMAFIVSAMTVMPLASVKALSRDVSFCHSKIDLHEVGSEWPQ